MQAAAAFFFSGQWEEPCNVLLHEGQVWVYGHELAAKGQEPLLKRWQTSLVPGEDDKDWVG